MYEFIQVSARKDSDNFVCCSNLSFMSQRGITPAEAESALRSMAGDYATNGYDVEWIREALPAEELDFWAHLFERDTFQLFDRE